MLSDLGSWASIFSLPITIWVLVETHRIKKKFAARVRVPEIRQELANVSRSYLSNIGRNGDRDAAHSDLAKIAALLKSLQDKVGTRSMTTLRPTIKRIDRVISSRTASDDDFWKAYQALIEIIASLEQMERDMPWS